MHACAHMHASVHGYMRCKHGWEWVSAASKLVVTIHEARGLMAKDKDGLSDPYVEVAYGVQTFKTRIVQVSLLWHVRSACLSCVMCAVLCGILYGSRMFDRTFHRTIDRVFHRRIYRMFHWQRTIRPVWSEQFVFNKGSAHDDLEVIAHWPRRRDL